MSTKGKTKSKLTAKQEQFCLLYATTEDFFGNGVRAYAEAFKLDLSKKGKYETAKTNAWRLLTNADILYKINQLLEDRNLNSAFVDKQLYFLIAQSKDYHVKLRAVQEYNKLKGRYDDAVIKVKSDPLVIRVTSYPAYSKKQLESLSSSELIELIIQQAELHSLI